MNREEGGTLIGAPPSSCTLAPVSFRAWPAAKLRLTAVLFALRLAELDLRFPVLDLHLAGLSLTSTLLCF